jgi:hypothetical protein
MAIACASLLAALWLAGCAHLEGDCATCADPVHFVGDPGAATVSVDPPRGGGTPVALGRFDRVRVIGRADGRVRIQRDLPYHPRLTAWVPADEVLRLSQFQPVSSWPRAERVRLCDATSQTCYRLEIATDGGFRMQQEGEDAGHRCALRPHLRPPLDSCTIQGRLRTARGHLLLRHADGYRAFFTRDAAGRWCDALGLRCGEAEPDAASSP